MCHQSIVANLPHGISPPTELLSRDPQQLLKSVLGTVQPLSVAVYLYESQD